MKKSIVTLLTAGLIAASMSMTTFAGEWQQNSTGWQYHEDNGSYSTNCWQWIDGNGDGVAECYYFDATGIMLANTTTPDGYQVDASGAWTELGIVRTKAVADTTQMPQGNENVSVPSGYNENGVSNLAIDILEHTRAENAAKYNEIKVDEIAGEYYVYYNNISFIVNYYKPDESEKPSRVSAIATDIFKDAPMTGNAYDDKGVLKTDGYSVTTNGGQARVDCGKYEVNLQSSTKGAEVYIKFDYK